MRVFASFWRWAVRFSAALGLLVMLVSSPPLLSWWVRALAGPWEDPSGDVLVVLTGSTVGETIGLSSYWRAVYATRAFRAEDFREIIISGGGAGTPAALPMRDFLVAQGVPAPLIRVETISSNTHESAEQVARLFAEDPARYQNIRVVLLTSDYHMFRASRVFLRAGLKLRPRPIPDALKREAVFWQRWGVFVDLTQETAKIVYYWARGWI